MAEETTQEHVRATSLPREITIIGGGTGLSTVVRGFSGEPFSGKGVTALVNTFDDGGSTGDIRQVYPELPAIGDMRQCFDAMADISPGLRNALNFRFAAGLESDRLKLTSQSQGNLMIGAIILSELRKGGNFSSALDIVGEMFNVKGRVVPVSDDIRTLLFTLPDGTKLAGEHAAEETNTPSLKGTLIDFKDERAEISGAAEAAIAAADMVVVAPGDLYTSIGPNLAVRGMKEALKKANVVMMLSNLMNRDRHTVGFTTADYVTEYERLVGGRFIDRVVYNTAQLDTVALAAQLAKGSHIVDPAARVLAIRGYQARGFDLLSHDTVPIDPNDAIGTDRSDIRHDPAKVASALLSVYMGDGFSG